MLNGASNPASREPRPLLIAATGLVILLKLDSSHQFFSLCDLEIWWMILKNYRAPLLQNIKLCAASQSPQWIQTGVTVRKRSIRVKIGEFLSRVTMKFDGRLWKTIGHLFYVAPSFKLASFYSHLWIQTKVTVPKRSIWVKIGDLLSPVTLKFDGWPWKRKGYLFYATSSFVHNFVAIGEFKLQL